MSNILPLFDEISKFDFLDPKFPERAGIPLLVGSRFSIWDFQSGSQPGYLRDPIRDIRDFHRESRDFIPPGSHTGSRVIPGGIPPGSRMFFVLGVLENIESTGTSAWHV